jgi:hypothetical protein
MLDERNRQIHDKRVEKHLRGLSMSRLMAMDGRNRKAYTYRALKNKPVPMPDQGLDWIPLLSKPLIDLNPPAFKLTVHRD